jgi:RNA polymerase sigma-70 factor (ECF subfamily)
LIDPVPREAIDVEAVFREVYGQAVGTLVRVFGDISTAEDAVQDAFVVATDRWPRDGVPPNPAGWIVTTARNRAVDVFRRSSRGRELHEEAAAAAATADPEDFGPVSDDQLRLMFTCCHPTLRLDHQVALTLRLLGGLSLEEIARSFLVGESAMAKRLVRAKHKIKANNIPYQIPREADLPDRLRSVLAVLYLIYNTGADDPERASLRVEAIRLARALGGLMPDEPEAAGLLALMLLSESRARARLVDGDIVLLRDQDRGRWDPSLIEEGQSIVVACVRRNRPGPYQIQAAIQAVHGDASRFEETDWVQVLALYDQLYEILPTPVVAMNRAIALAEVEGPAVALEALDSLAPDLDGYHLFHSARSAMLTRLGKDVAAGVALERAIELAPSEKDRRFLKRHVRSPSSATVT